MTIGEKLIRILINTTKGIAVLVLLYFFIISIDLLGSSFQLLAGSAIFVFCVKHLLVLLGVQFDTVHVLFHVAVTVHDC